MKILLPSQVLRRYWILRVLGLPENRHHPPALAIVDQLKAVDTSRERLCIVGFVPGFVGAEDVRDVGVMLDLV